ncbi:hypothetical protein ERJ75_001113400 [Trypanosoma vivax]|nr:hypothetical protein ERJ75_001113400 [Trypanosoma vivax]
MPGSATISFSHADMQWQMDAKNDRRGSERNGTARKAGHTAVGVATDAVNSLSDQRLRTHCATKHLEMRGSRATKRSRPTRGKNAKCQARVGGQRTARCAVRHAARKNGHCKMARGGREEQRQKGSAAVGFLFSGAAANSKHSSVFFTTEVGRVSADGCLSLCRCLRACGSRLLPWRALGCATPAATALCDTAGMERVGAEITQVWFARRRAGTQLAEGRGCDAGKTKGGSFACLLPTAPDVLACQELVVKVVCGFFWQRGERRAQQQFGSFARVFAGSRRGATHARAKECTERRARGRNSEVGLVGPAKRKSATRGTVSRRGGAETPRTPCISHGKAATGRGVRSPSPKTRHGHTAKTWALHRLTRARAGTAARKSGKLKRSLDMVGPRNKSEQGQGAGRQPPRLGTAHAR